MRLSKKQYRSLAMKLAWKRKKQKEHQDGKELKAVYVTCLLRKKGSKESIWKCSIKLVER
jgi:hypothetical protein